MRKLFTLFAALCCTLFSVMATPVSDGAIIKIGTTTVTEENKSDVLGDGKVSYDPSTHTLSLSDGLNITDGLSIDVDGHTFGVKISVTGNVSIKGKNIPLHFIGFNYGYPLTIEGDENAQLDIMWNGGSSGPAVLCAKELTSSSSDAFTFKAQGGMRINLNNHMADTYEALRCHHIDLNNVTLSLTAWNSVDALGSLSSTDDVLKQTEACWYAANEVTFYKYTTKYPVKINGFQLSDGKDNLSMADMKAISSGQVSYNPATHTLAFTGEFTMSADVPSEPAIEITGDDEITLQGADISWAATTITAPVGTGAALRAEAPIIINIGSAEMKFESAEGAGIDFEKDLTIKTNDTEKRLLVYGETSGISSSGTDPKLTIDHCGVLANGHTGNSFSGFALTQTGVTLKDANQEWDNSLNCVKNSMDVCVTDASVEFILSEWKLAVAADPAEGGTVAITGKANPYWFSADETVELTATANTGWKFDHWLDIADPSDENYAKSPRSVDITKGANVTYTAVFESTLPKHKITVKVADGQDARGYVMPAITEQEYPEGTKLTIQAFANKYWIVEKWSDGGDPTHEITVGTTDAVYTAYFIPDPNNKAFPIWVGGTQIDTENLIMTNSNNTAIAAGSVVFDEASNTLTLNGANIQPSSGVCPLVIGSATEPANITVVLATGASNLVGNSADVIQIVNSKVTITGDQKLSTATSWEHYAIGLNKAEVTLKGLVGPSLLVGGTAESIKGVTGNEKLIIIGSDVKLNGNGAAVNNINFENKYCTITPAGTEFVAADKTFKKSDVVQSQVTFTSLPKITVTPVEKGTGHFKLTSENNTTGFTDEGWFEAGEEISVVAEPEKGFIFARWTDDSNWKDPDLKVAANKHDKITMPAGGITKAGMALFYKQSSSNVVWYGISDGKFVQFKSRDYGANVIESTTDASGITAGDFNGSQYYIAEGGEIKRFSFSSVTKGNDQANYDKATKVADYSGTIYDMAWNFKDNRLYAIMDNDGKLYKLNTSTDPGTLDEVGSFKTGELKTPVTARALAIDASGKKYILSSTSMLYVVIQENTKDKEVLLEPVGDHGGAINAIVSNEPQSLTFDHVSGELYWGAADYLRIIDTKTANSYIAGDLRQTKGSQGVIRALQRRDRKVTVTVEVAEACKDMGTAIIGTEGETAEQSMIQGTSVTISAIPAEGYQFAYWVQKVDEDAEAPEQIKENPYSFSASSITYVAYFEATQGIEDVKIGNVQCTKMLIDGHLYIIRDNRIYNVQGVRVK